MCTLKNKVLYLFLSSILPTQLIAATVSVDVCAQVDATPSVYMSTVDYFTQEIYTNSVFCSSVMTLDTLTGDGASFEYGGTFYWEDSLAAATYINNYTAGIPYDIVYSWNYTVSIDNIQAGESVYTEATIGSNIYGSYVSTTSAGSFTVSGVTDGFYDTWPEKEHIFEMSARILASYTPVAPVPLPGALLLLLSGLGGMGLMVRGRKTNTTG